MRIFFVVVGFLAVLSWPVSAQQLDSSGVKGLFRLQDAGASEQLLLAWVRSTDPAVVLTATEVDLARSKGVPASVISAIMARQAPRNLPTVTEAELFRLYFDRLFYNGHIWDVSSGLPTSLSLVISKDPQAQPPLKIFQGYKSASAAFSWSGFGLLLGGGIYGVVTAANASANTSVNAGIAFGAIGAGILSSVVGFLTGQAGDQTLYDTLFQYNNDLINGSFTGGN